MNTSGQPGRAGHRAVIVGGGIGGLAAAVSLVQSGWGVTVLERSPGFDQIGAGFGLAHNGLAALAALGLGHKARAAAHGVAVVGTMDWRGRWLIHLPDEEHPGPLRVLYGIHRQALHHVLLTAASGAELRTSAAVTAIEPGTADHAPARVRVEAASGPYWLEADLVVGADGLRSVARTAIAPESRLRYSGMSSWRGIVDDDARAVGPFAMMWGPGAEFGALRVNARQIYWYGYARMPERTTFVDERDTALRRFRGWADPVARLIEHTSPRRLLRHDVYTLTRQPSSYVRGRLVLIGDAAHPMLPTMGQGANTALEDAVSISRLIGLPGADGQPLDVGLARFNHNRYKRTQHIVRRSALTARFGSHLTSAAAGRVRDGLLRALPAERLGAAGSAILNWEPPPPIQSDPMSRRT